MRRPRSFWEARVAELADGRSVERVARRHGLIPARLSWWRWRLGSESTTALARPRMIEIVPTRSMAAADRAGVRILVGDIVVELPLATTPEDLGRIVGAIRATC